MQILNGERRYSIAVSAHTIPMNRLKTLQMNFLKCGVTGWCLEVLFTSLESIMAHDWRLMGKTSLLMFPIYGCGVLLSPIARLTDWWIGGGVVRPVDRAFRHGMLYVVLIFTMEYASGAWLRARGMCPWDYTGRQLNINGLIRLDFAPLWFGTGLLFEQITKKKGR